MFIGEDKIDAEINGDSRGEGHTSVGMLSPIDLKMGVFLAWTIMDCSNAGKFSGLDNGVMGLKYEPMQGEGVVSITGSGKTATWFCGQLTAASTSMLRPIRTAL